MKLRKLLIVAVIAVIVIFVRIILLLTALPKPSVDYVAQYNKLSKPADYNPELNAAPHYQKAYELYLEPSPGLNNVRFPDDKQAFYNNPNPKEWFSLEKWIQSNKPTIDQVKLALQKSYYWFEKISEKDLKNSFYLHDELFRIREISELLTCLAKLKILHNNFPAATDDLIACYAMGQHYCRQELSSMEQQNGIATKSKAVEIALEFLYYTNPSTDELKYLQDRFQNIINKDSYVPGIEAEKIRLYDTVQRVYLRRPIGIDKPSFRILFDMSKDRMGGGYRFKIWKHAFTGSSRNETVKQIDEMFFRNNFLRDKTPWQIQHEFTNEIREIEAINSTLVAVRFIPFFVLKLFESNQKANIQAEALIAVAAVLRYQQDHHRLPTTLEELIMAGYLETIPLDPYSQESLLYQIKGDDFVLYSVGEDFKDNGGEPVTIDEGMVGMMGLMGLKDPESTPRRAVYKDIIYWPVNDIPYYDSMMSF